MGGLHVAVENELEGVIASDVGMTLACNLIKALASNSCEEIGLGGLGAVSFDWEICRCAVRFDWDVCVSTV